MLFMRDYFWQFLDNDASTTGNYFNTEGSGGAKELK